MPMPMSMSRNMNSSSRSSGSSPGSGSGSVTHIPSSSSVPLVDDFGFRLALHLHGPERVLDAIQVQITEGTDTDTTSTSSDMRGMGHQRAYQDQTRTNNISEGRKLYWRSPFQPLSSRTRSRSQFQHGNQDDGIGIHDGDDNGQKSDERNGCHRHYHHVYFLDVTTHFKPVSETSPTCRVETRLGVFLQVQKSNTSIEKQKNKDNKCRGSDSDNIKDTNSSCSSSSTSMYVQSNHPLGLSDLERYSDTICVEDSGAKGMAEIMSKALRVGNTASTGRSTSALHSDVDTGTDAVKTSASTASTNTAIPFKVKNYEEDEEKGLLKTVSISAFDNLILEEVDIMKAENIVMKDAYVGAKAMNMFLSHLGGGGSSHKDQKYLSTNNTCAPSSPSSSSSSSSSSAVQNVENAFTKWWNVPVPVAPRSNATSKSILKSPQSPTHKKTPIVLVKKSPSPRKIKSNSNRRAHTGTTPHTSTSTSISTSPNGPCSRASGVANPYFKDNKDKEEASNNSSNYHTNGNGNAHAHMAEQETKTTTSSKMQSATTAGAGAGSGAVLKKRVRVVHGAARSRKKRKGKMTFGKM